jgi:hypothetical protein
MPWLLGCPAVQGAGVDPWVDGWTPVQWGYFTQKEFRTFVKPTGISAMTNMPFHPGRRWAGHGLASLVCATVLLSACGGGGGGAPSAAPANTVAAPTDPTSGSGAGGGSGTLALFAGSETTAGTQDGAANVAGFNNPQGLAVDAAGNVYVADTDNFAIRKITPEGVVSTVAGQIGVKGHADGGKSDATFNGPTGIALDASGNIYVSDMGGFNAIRKVTPQGDVLTLVNTEMDKAVQFNGSALVPFGGVAVNASGSKVYFSAIIPLVSPTNMGIFTLSPDGAVTLLAGGGAGSADGQGAAAGFANVPGPGRGGGLPVRQRLVPQHREEDFARWAGEHGGGCGGRDLPCLFHTRLHQPGWRGR